MHLFFFSWALKTYIGSYSMECVSWKECNTGFLGREKYTARDISTTTKSVVSLPLAQGRLLLCNISSPQRGEAGLALYSSGHLESGTAAAMEAPWSPIATGPGEVEGSHRWGKLGVLSPAHPGGKIFFPTPQAAHLARRLGISPGKGPCHSLKGYHCFHSC